MTQLHPQQTDCVASAADLIVGPSSAFAPWEQSRRALRLNRTFNAPTRLIENIRRLAQTLHTLQQVTADIRAHASAPSRSARRLPYSTDTLLKN